MPALASSAQLLAFPGPGISVRAALLTQLKLHRLPEHLIEAFLREAVSLPGTQHRRSADRSAGGADAAGRDRPRQAHFPDRAVGRGRDQRRAKSSAIMPD